MHYLLKTEPSTYSFADLVRDMAPGDGLIIYHTGDEKAAVGRASVVSVEVKDPRNPQVKIKAGKGIARPVTLAEMKSSALFKDSLLVRQGRLSVVPLTAAQHKFLVE